MKLVVIQTGGKKFPLPAGNKHKVSHSGSEIGQLRDN